MKKLYIFTLFICLYSSNGFTQGSMDFGLNLGGASYLGEIGGSEGEAKPWLLDMKLSQSNIAIGGFFRYDIARSISLKLSVNYIRIEGADSLSDEPSRVARNLSFRTDMIEAVLTGEYKFIQMNDLSRRSRQKVDFSSYVFAGIGALFYYPYAQYQDKWYYLRPLQTEGPENAYDEMTIAIPLGVGANFTFNRKIKLGLEIGYRFTFTDYLDDISTDFAYDPKQPELSQEMIFEESKIFANRSDEAFRRGDSDLPERNFYNYGSIRGGSDANDGYLVAQIGLSYQIGGGNSFYKSKYNSIINRRRKRTKF